MWNSFWLVTIAQILVALSVLTSGCSNREFKQPEAAPQTANEVALEADPATSEIPSPDTIGSKSDSPPLTHNEPPPAQLKLISLSGFSLDAEFKTTTSAILRDHPVQTSQHIFRLEEQDSVPAELFILTENPGNTEFRSVNVQVWNEAHAIQLEVSRMAAKYFDDDLKRWVTWIPLFNGHFLNDQWIDFDGAWIEVEGYTFRMAHFAASARLNGDLPMYLGFKQETVDEDLATDRQFRLGSAYVAFYVKPLFDSDADVIFDLEWTGLPIQEITDAQRLGATLLCEAHVDTGQEFFQDLSTQIAPSIHPDGFGLTLDLTPIRSHFLQLQSECLDSVLQVSLDLLDSSDRGVLQVEVRLDANNYP